MYVYSDVGRGSLTFCLHILLTFMAHVCFLTCLLLIVGPVSSSVLHCVAVYCGVLQCAAVCCSALQCDAVCCSVVQCYGVCCSVLQCVAVCCSVLQCIACDAV